MKKLPILIIAMVTMPIFSVAILGFTHAFHVRELKPLGEIGTFQLKDSFGNPFTERHLRKKIWIASFVFTSCDEQCPRIGAQLKKIQTALYSKENIRLVTFSVDPNRDTPERMREFGERFGVRTNRWALLTGEKEEIDRVLGDFQLSGGEVPNMPKGMITHSNYLVLVDGDGVMRGRYDAFEEEKVTQLIKDAKSLLRGLY